ncbi:MAG: hypothetical protein JW808_11375 [Victivallales bacterium]|nr:hypothetical protein [Victivallales bacterium]
MAPRLEYRVRFMDKVKMAEVDFQCFDNGCDGLIKFNLKDALCDDFQALCSACHRSYEFDDMLKGKLRRLCDLIVAVRDAEDILGTCNVAVTVPAGMVKIPYALLLTRLNTMITLQLDGKDVDFHFRVEPSSPETFR